MAKSSIRIHSSVLLSSIAVLLTCATAQAGNLYWGAGSVDIADGTPLITNLWQLSGTWDTTTRNWATSTAGTTYAAWSNTGTNNGAYFGATMTSWARYNDATITLAGDMSLNRIYADFTYRDMYNAEFFLAAGAARTVTLNGSSPTIWVSNQADGNGGEVLSFESTVAMAGTSGFRKTGGGYLWVRSNSSGLTGEVIEADGGINLMDGGSLAGISAFKVYSPVAAETEWLGVVVASTGPKNQLGNTSVVTLHGGTFRYEARNNATDPSTETIGKIVVDGFGRLDPTVASGSLAHGRLILSDAVAGIDRGPSGKGTLIVGAYRGNVLAFPTDVVVQHGYTPGEILPWMSHNSGYAVVLRPDNVISNLPMADAPLDLTTWAAGADYRVRQGTASYTGQIPTVAIRSLGASLPAACSLTIGAGNLLTVSSGYVGTAWDVGVSSWTAKNLTLTGGMLTSGAADLYLHSSQNVNSMTVSCVITGNINVVIGGRQTVTFGGGSPNVYSGTTYAMGGTLALSKTGGSLDIPGDLYIGPDVTVSPGANASHIKSTAAITVRGLLNHYQQDHAYNGVVTIAGGRIRTQNGDTTFAGPGYGLVFNGGLWDDDSNNTICDLLTNVRYESSAESQALFTTTASQQIRLASAAGAYVRTFDVDDSGTLSSGLSEMVVSMGLTDTTGTATVRKTGDGVLEFTRANSYEAGTSIAEGLFLANNTAGSATGTGSVIVTNTGTLGGSGTVYGAVTVHSGATIDPGATLDATGTLSVSNTVTFLSGGTLHVDLASGANDRLLLLNGNLTVAGQVSPALLGGYDPPRNTQWTIATVPAAGTISIGSAAVDYGYSLSVSGSNLILSNPTRGTLIMLR